MECLKINSTEPEIIGSYDIACDEMMFYLYLPIKMAGNNVVKMGERLEPFWPLVDAVLKREGDITDKYLYLTAKHVYTPAGIAANRPGWHSDGFGTDDVNYVFYNNTPTEFSIREFVVSADDKKSLHEFEMQALYSDIKTYPVNSLIRLTPDNIHRATMPERGTMRLFVKLSISKDRYNLKGNSRNYLFNYNWDLESRMEERNQPQIL